MARTDVSKEELMRLVIDEVDQARDILQLAEQLSDFLPIRSMDELVKATEGKEMRFRDASFTTDTLAAHIPSIAFPVDDVRGLVERLGYLLRMTPPALGVDLESSDGIRRRLRQSSAIGSNLGLIQANNVAASTIVPGLMPADVTPGTTGPEK